MGSGARLSRGRGEGERGVAECDTMLKTPSRRPKAKGMALSVLLRAAATASSASAVICAAKLRSTS